MISEPLRSAASTTTTASDSPAITALRVGKWCGSGGVPGANCDTSAPRATISSASRAFSGGYTTSTPEPNTAMLRPPTRSAPRCAAVSMPRARPLTMVTPRAARSAASVSATSSPYGVARRDPTTATASASSSTSAPRTWSVGGAVGTASRCAGYSASPRVSARAAPA